MLEPSELLLGPPTRLPGRRGRGLLIFHGLSFRPRGVLLGFLELLLIASELFLDLPELRLETDGSRWRPREGHRGAAPVARCVGDTVDGTAVAEHQIQQRSAFVAVLRADGIFVLAEGTPGRNH